MPTISQLTAVSSLTDTDQVPVYSTDNGDARKASISTFKEFILTNVELINPILIAPNLGTPLEGNLINCIGLPIAGGGTGASTADGALTNFGGTTVGKAVFTAVDAAAGRLAISAAKSGVNSDITSITGLSTPLGVTQGGTGLATLTINAVVLGNGTSAPTFVSPGPAGSILTSDGTTWASIAAPTSGVTSFSAGTTGLTPAIATGGTVTLGGTLATTNGGTGQSTLAAARGAFGSGVSSRKTANYTAVAGDVLACDTIAVGAFTVTLPLSPVAGDAPIKIYDAGTTTAINGFATNNLTIARNGNTIHTLAEDVIVSTKGVTIVCEYVNGTWRLYNG